MTRSPQDVFADHVSALALPDVTALGEDYADGALLLTAQGAEDGRQGTATATAGHVDDGADTCGSPTA